VFGEAKLAAVVESVFPCHGLSVGIELPDESGLQICQCAVGIFLELGACAEWRFAANAADVNRSVSACAERFEF
jgi:hypothetical protein